MRLIQQTLPEISFLEIWRVDPGIRKSFETLCKVSDRNSAYFVS